MPIVFSTTALPNNDLPARHPPSDPGPRSNWGRSALAEPDGPPTLRVPVAAPSVAAGPLVVTPPPLSDLKLPASEWSADGEDDIPTARRGPRVGDTVLGFKLVGELGRGAFARVYLAHQEALAARPVALKVTMRPTREAERLARLQHTNIVPVYSVHDEGSVQLICMPFLGRTTIADLIRAYRVDFPSRHSGRKSTSARAGRTTALNNSKSQSSKSAPDSKGRSGGHRTPVWTWDAAGPPPIVGDPRAVLEVLSQLAAGLAHAHERGILHLDLKPANVLLADTGEPMLLDFNLSFDAARPDRELVGGTMPYMAIEQLLDMRNRGKGLIDARTDLYALGVMAFEMLTGTVPFAPSLNGARDIDAMVAARSAGPPALRPLNPAVTPAVEAILRKLMAPDPADRYQCAEDLRTDVERHLNDLPLVYAREQSARERLGKWRRRNPGVPVRMLAACLIGLTLGFGGIAQRKAEATARAGATEHARVTRAALDTTRLDLVLPDDPKARARGIARANEILASYGLPDDPNWRKRDEVRLLSESDRAALGGDLGELLFLLAHVKLQDAKARPESERRELAAEAWKLNGAARACFPSDAVPAVLDRQAATTAPLAGEEFVPGAPQEPTSDPRLLFLEAAEQLSRGGYVAAEQFLDRATTAQPSHGAAQFCLAYCRHQLGQHTRAAERYDVARAMLPTDPRPAYQRGRIFTLTKKYDQAEVEFAKAIERTAESTDAYRQRGLARLYIGTEQKLEEAEADLTIVIERGDAPLVTHLIRARVREARGDKAGAALDRATASKLTPTTETEFYVRGWSRTDSDPKGALADYDQALAINPRSLVALQNKAHVLADKMKDNDAALVVATRVVELYPEFATAHAGRAVLLARLNRPQEARAEIARARKFAEDAEILYLTACVYARTATTDKERAEAIDVLRKALREGYSDLRSLTKDPDLDPVRGLKEFQELLQSAVVYNKPPNSKQ